MLDDIIMGFVPLMRMYFKERMVFFFDGKIMSFEEVLDNKERVRKEIELSSKPFDIYVHVPNKNIEYRVRIESAKTSPHSPAPDISLN